jgi:hypothetical protein
VCTSQNKSQVAKKKKLWPALLGKRINATAGCGSAPAWTMQKKDPEEKLKMAFSPRNTGPTRWSTATTITAYTVRMKRVHIFIQSRRINFLIIGLIKQQYDASRNMQLALYELRSSGDELLSLHNAKRNPVRFAEKSLLKVLFADLL